MGIKTLIIYLLASFLLEFILHYKKKKYGENFIFDIILAITYLCLLAGITASFNLTDSNDVIFLVIFFAEIEDIFITYVIREVPVFKNDDYYFKKAILTVLISYFLNILFINNVSNVFLSAEEFRVYFWIIITFCFYLCIRKDLENKLTTKRKQKLFYHDKEYIVTWYAKLRLKYDYLINFKNNNLTYLTYAIMIYENHSKPELLRKIDNYIYKLTNKPGCFGIMQIYSKDVLDDVSSIKIAVKKINNSYLSTKRKRVGYNKYFIEDIITCYYKKKNKKEIKEIVEIYKVIKSFNSN